MLNQEDIKTIEYVIERYKNQEGLLVIGKYDDEILIDFALDVLKEVDLQQSEKPYKVTGKHRDALKDHLRVLLKSRYVRRNETHEEAKDRFLQELYEDDTRFMLCSDARKAQIDFIEELLEERL